MTDDDFELRLHSDLRELAEPAPPSLRASVVAIPEEAASLERRGPATGWGLPAVLRFATLAVAASAVVVVVLVAVGPPVRPPGQGGPIPLPSVDHEASPEVSALPVVDCGPLDQSTCDRAVADIIATHRQGWEEGREDQLPPDLPVLSVVIGPGGVTESGCVWEYEIIWPGGGWVVQQSCADADPLPTPTAVVGSPDVGVPYLVVVKCTADFPLGDTWWRFDNAGPTPGPVYEDLRGSVRASVTLTSPDTAILRFADLPELMLSRVDEPIEASCYGV
jgi:hypothetical protein